MHDLTQNWLNQVPNFFKLSQIHSKVSYFDFLVKEIKTQNCNAEKTSRPQNPWKKS